MIKPLIEWRVGRNLSLASAARQVGVTSEAWRRWEAGLRTPDRRAMPRVRAITGLSADIFYPADDEQPVNGAAAE